MMSLGSRAFAFTANVSNNHWPQTNSQLAAAKHSPNTREQCKTTRVRDSCEFEIHTRCTNPSPQGTSPAQHSAFSTAPHLAIRSRFSSTRHAARRKHCHNRQPSGEIPCHKLAWLSFTPLIRNQAPPCEEYKPSRHPLLALSYTSKKVYPLVESHSQFELQLLQSASCASEIPVSDNSQRRSLINFVNYLAAAAACADRVVPEPTHFGLKGVCGYFRMQVCFDFLTRKVACTLKTAQADRPQCAKRHRRLKHTHGDHRKGGPYATCDRIHGQAQMRTHAS